MPRQSDSISLPRGLRRAVMFRRGEGCSTYLVASVRTKRCARNVQRMRHLTWMLLRAQPAGNIVVALAAPTEMRWLESGSKILAARLRVCQTLGPSGEERGAAVIRATTATGRVQVCVAAVEAVSMLVVSMAQT